MVDIFSFKNKTKKKPQKGLLILSKGRNYLKIIFSVLI